MIINLKLPREQYFKDLSVADILRKFIHKDGDIRVKDIQQLPEERGVIGTTTGSLDELLAQSQTINSLGLVEQIKQLKEDQLLILPPQYRIESSDVREMVAYSLDTLVNGDSSVLKRALFDKSQLKGKLSQKRKQQYEWTPEKVLDARFTHLYEEKEVFAEQQLSCYAWWGKDNHRHIVSLYRAIQGAELRAFQDFAAFRLLIPSFNKELRTGLNARTRKPLTPEEISDKTAKVQRYTRYMAVRDITSEIKRLDVHFTDLIEPQGTFSYQTGQMMRVPSRAKIKRVSDDPRHPNYKDISHHTYSIKLTDVPILEKDNLGHFSLCWEVAGNCNCQDKVYRSDRRKQEADKGMREDFYCAHEIAACHTLRKKYEGKIEKTIKYLPFVLPTKEMMEYVDRLSYQTIMLYFKEDTQKWSKRSLNHTEIENLLWKKVMRDGYSACFTTEIEKFKEQRYDPHLDLVKFREV